MPVLQDRVQETTTTGGTGTIALAGAVTGYRSFNAAFTIGDITYYTIDNGSGEWEIGVGTVGSGTLSRNSVLESSNANALVNFGSGTKRVFCSAPTKVLLPDQTSNSGKVLTTNGTDPSWTTTLNGITLGNITPGSGAFTTLSASSTVSGTGFSTYLASPPAIGGTTPAAGNFTTLGATGNVTLGDAAGDTLTINGTAVSCPNNLNFDSNTLFIDAANNRVGLGTSSPGTKLDVNGIAGWSGNTTGVSAQIVEASSGANGGGNLRVLSNTSATTNAGGSITLGGYYSGTANSIDFAQIIGAKENSTAGNAAGYLAFCTRQSGGNNTEVVRIDSSGNLGLGVTPSAWGTNYKASEVKTSAIYDYIGTSGGLVFNAYYNGTNWIYKGTGGSAWATRYEQGPGHTWYTAPTGTAGATILFNQAMTLDASGRLLVGLTSNNGTGALIQTNGGVSISASSALAGYVGANLFRVDSTTIPTLELNNQGATGRFVTFQTNGASQVGSISFTASSTAYNTSSDQRLKTNVEPAGSAIQSILDFPVDQFDWISSGEHQDFGGIAQKIIPIIPEMVSVPEDPEEMMGVDWSKAVPRLIRAYQELHQEIETLKQRIH